MLGIPIVYILGGRLVGMILRVHWLDTAGWRWLFLLEGVPAILLGIATLFVLPDRPNEVRWLQPEERDWLSARLAEERRAKAHVEHVTIWQALRHRAVLMLTAGLFFCYTGGYAFWFWMPTMLQRLTGWTDVQRIGWIGDSVCCGSHRNAAAWLELRSHARAPLAFCHPTINRCASVGRVVPCSAFDRTANRGVHADRLRNGGISAIVLGAPVFISHQLGGCSSGRLHQLHGQHWRILWS